MKKVLVMTVAALLLLAAAPAAIADSDAFKMSGDIRTRIEDLNNYGDFDDDNGDREGIWPYRIRLNLAGSLAENVAWQLDIHNFGAWGNQDPINGTPFPGGQNVDTDIQSQTAIYQAYVALNKIGGSRFSATVGRQEYNLGNGMILGNEPFYNGNTFDGIKGVFDAEKWDLTGFVFTTMERNDPASSFFTGPGNEDEQIQGLVFTTMFGDKAAASFDGYLIHHQQQTLAVTGFKTEAYILGVHWRRMVETKADLDNSRWDYSAELALEDGTDRDNANTEFDFSGHMFEGHIGYVFGSETTHKVFLGYVTQAGDDDQTDSDFSGWSGLFPTVHNRFGAADFFGASFNSFDAAITAVKIGWQMNMKEGKHKVGVTYWMFSPTEDEVVISPGLPPTEVDDYGSEIDLGYKYKYSSNVSMALGIAQLMPDEGLAGGGGAPDDSVTRMLASIKVTWP